MVFFMVFPTGSNAQPSDTMSGRLAQSWYQWEALRCALLGRCGAIIPYNHANYLMKMA